MEIISNNAINTTSFQRSHSIPKRKPQGHHVHTKHKHNTTYYLNGKKYYTEAAFNAAQERLKTVQRGALIGGGVLFALGLLPCCSVLGILGAVTMIAGTAFADRIADFLKKKGILK